jgi:HTH-type transcriptional regulator / antitoxin HipB
VNYPIRLAAQLRDHLRSLRKHNDLTQSELGSRVGVGQARIAEIESDPGSISVDQLFKVLSALGASITLHDARSAPAEKSPSSRAPTLPKRSPGRTKKVAKKREVPQPPSGSVSDQPKKGAW